MNQSARHSQTSSGMDISTSTMVLLLLLIVDLMLFAVHLSHRFLGEPASIMYNIGTDRGFPEFFQYIKQIWLSVILFVLFLRDKALVFIFWSVLAGILFLDDALQVHEILGEKISRYAGFGGAFGLRAQDFGELVAAAILALPLLVAFVVGIRSKMQQVRSFSLGLFVLFVLLGVFGVLIDLFVHAMQSHTLFFIEDGGEMIVVTLMLWYSIRYFDSGEVTIFRGLS